MGLIGLIGHIELSYESYKSHMSYFILMIVLSHDLKAKIRIEPGVSQSTSATGMKFE
jgi:hypothetical protein